MVAHYVYQEFSRSKTGILQKEQYLNMYSGKPIYLRIWEIDGACLRGKCKRKTGKYSGLMSDQYVNLFRQAILINGDNSITMSCCWLDFTFHVPHS